ncbi:MAG: hypothetical protein EBR82_41780 [Caulobacteraceae bacterium]|nr:hypothetical protein [Caulobacteraceae bacterium]
MARRKRQRRTVYIGEQRWKITRARLRGIYGDCNYATRTIRLHGGLRGVDLLDTLIHELIHARWPDLSEDAVVEFSETLSAVLDAEGFRHAEDQEE